MRELDFFQVVDSDGIVVPFAGKKNLDKVGDHAKLVEFPRASLYRHGHGLVGRAHGLTAHEVVFPPNALGHIREGKVIEAPTHVAARIALLQPPGENVGQSCSGNDPQLTLLGNGMRQPPSRNARSHSTLND